MLRSVAADEQQQIPPEAWPQIVAHADELAATLVLLREEISRREAAGDIEGAGRLQARVPDVELAVSELRDLVTVHQAGKVARRHGPGPYSFDDLVAFTGANPERLARVIDQLVDEGLMTRDDDSPA